MLQNIWKRKIISIAFLVLVTLSHSMGIAMEKKGTLNDSMSDVVVFACYGSIAYVCHVFASLAYRICYYDIWGEDITQEAADIKLLKLYALAGGAWLIHKGLISLA